MIEKIKIAIANHNLFNEIIPINDSENDYGYGSCEIRYKLWDTKWDICMATYNIIGEKRIEAIFDTAWGPAIKIYEKMAELGYKIAATYYEPGMGFCGIWNNRQRHITWNIEGNSYFMSKILPKKLNFVIEQMKEQEEDEDEEYEAEDEDEDEYE